MKKPALNLLLIIFMGCVSQVSAQYEVPPPAPSGDILPSTQLDQLTGRIALYPDPLISEILPAATLPSQIAAAHNYILQNGDPNLVDQQPWDSSVKAVAHYPDVLNMMNGDLEWTVEIGRAFVNQPNDVMDSVQRLRAQAQALGNLPNTPQETVVDDDGEIEIAPADPNMIYVPEYDPGIIFYQRPYGRSFLSWGIGFRVGGWLDHDFDWHDHHVVVWGGDHPRPANWWHEAPAQRREAIRNGNVWRPPAEANRRGPVVINRGEDRGYENRNRQAAPVRDVGPRSVPQRTEPVRQAAPVQRAEPVQRPVQVRTISSPPAVSAFSNIQNARDTRAASLRGSQSLTTQTSRPAPVSRPVSSAPAASRSAAPSRPSGGSPQRH